MVRASPEKLQACDTRAIGVRLGSSFAGTGFSFARAAGRDEAGRQLEPSTTLIAHISKCGRSAAGATLAKQQTARSKPAETRALAAELGAIFLILDTYQIVIRSQRN